MRRFLLTLPIALVLFTGAAVPAYAANLPLLNPNFTVVPTACTACPCGWGGILQLAQNLMNLGISIGVIAFVLVAAYAGLQFMVNPTNPEARSQAKNMLLNVAVGMFIVLSAWLIVDFIMKTLYNSGSSYGPWNSILKDPKGGDPCIQPTQVTSVGEGIANGLVNTLAGVGNIPNTGACNATNVAQAAAGGGVRMSATEASTLACLAGPESGCGTVMQNYNWNGVKSSPPSTAYGPFQITLKGNAQCFENSACYAAAGVSGHLDCASAFDSHGMAIPGDKLNQCKTAAANMTCSSVAAHCVYSTQGAGAWTKDPNNSKQQACIASNGG